MYVIRVAMLVMLLEAVACFNEDIASGVFGKIKAGFELAGKILGFDQAGNLAQMVSQTFSSKHSKVKKENENVFGGFLRLLGLDTKKLSAITVNAIIFIAQLISTTHSKARPVQVTEARYVREGTPMDWMMNNTRISNMFSRSIDSDLPQHILEYIKERSLDENSDCIQLLICKNAPFIWTMQKTLNTTTKIRGMGTFFAHLPSIDEYAANADDCEKKHPYCLIDY